MKPRTETDMGFGILFIGYFFILNFPYCEFTDAFAAALMMYALYKLSHINRGFRLALYSSFAFVALGVFELTLAVWDMLAPIGSDSLLLLLPALIRHLLIAFTSFLMLNGMREVADEVGLSAISKKCERRAYATVVIYALNIFLESASLAKFIDARILAVSYVMCVAATLVITALNLAAIYSCYMRICMPGDEDAGEKRSRFEFINSFRRHEEEKQREYQEYRLEQLRKKQAKGKNKDDRANKKN